MAGHYGEGTCTIEVEGRGTPYVIAGETLADAASAVKLVFTVGTNGLAGGTVADDSGQVVFRFPAGSFDATAADDYWAWLDAQVSVEVRNHLGTLLTENTDYKLLKQDESRLRVFPLGVSLQSGATVTVKLWGRVTRIATTFKTYHKAGKVIFQVESREDATLNTSIVADSHNEFEQLDAHIADMPGLEVRNASLGLFLVVAPMVVAWEGSRTAEFDLAVVALDNYVNGCANPAYTGTITLESDMPWQVDGDTPSTSRQVTFTSGEAGVKVLQHVRLTERPTGDFAWIEADLAGVGGVANPIRIEDSPSSIILVGDPHVHPEVDHRQNFAEPAACCRAARDWWRLDLLGLIEHGWAWHTDARWPPRLMYERQTDAAAEYTSDRFAVFQGWEWTCGQGGNTGCETLTGPNHHLIYSFPIQAHTYYAGFNCRVLRTEAELFAKMDSLGHNYVALTHPMHGQKQYQLDIVNSREPLGEIVSYKAAKHHDGNPATDGTYLPFAWPRSFELPGYNPNWADPPDDPATRYRYSIRYAWAQCGHDLGIYAAGDDHTERAGYPNRPGFGIQGSTTHFYKRVGLAFCRVASANAGLIFLALLGKHTYGSSGVRIYADLDVRQAGGTWVRHGDKFSLAAGAYDFEVRFTLAGCANLRRVEVYRYEPGTPTAGELGDGWLLVKRYSKDTPGDPLEGGARSLAVTLTKLNADNLGTVTLGNDDLIFYLFGQQAEGTDTDLTGAAYDWTLSGSGTSEYYCTLVGGGNPSLARPLGGLLIAGMDAPRCAPGSLTARSWGYGNNDALGYSTVYVRLADGTDPDTKAAGFLKHLSYGGNGVWIGPVRVQKAA